MKHTNDKFIIAWDKYIGPAFFDAIKKAEEKGFDLRYPFSTPLADKVAEMELQKKKAA